MNVRAHLMFRSRQRLLQEKIRRYATSEPGRIEAIQVERFNRVWDYCLREVPFYQSWQKDHHLPARISRTEELLAFPVLTKRSVAENAAVVFQNGRLTKYISTGGSVGIPARFPIGAKDGEEIWANAYLGRSWWGIRPFDRQLLIWGHNHLFGEGVRARIVGLRRDVQDFLINARRLSAYEMSDGALAAHAAQFHADQPALVVGYTSAIFRLARYIEDRGLARRSDALKGVVLTSETVSQSDIDVVTRVFGCPAIIEYGGAEAGIIAYSRYAAEPMRLQLMWDSHIAVSDHGDIRITTISDRLFPLINYDIGDRTLSSPDGARTVTEFDTISGRTQDFVTLPGTDGRELVISGIMLVHLLKPDPHVRSVSVQQHPGHAQIYIEGTDGLDLDRLKATFDRDMRTDHPTYNPGTVGFIRTTEPLMTIAGKHVLMRPAVRPEGSPPA